MRLSFIHLILLSTTIHFAHANEEIAKINKAIKNCTKSQIKTTEVIVTIEGLVDGKCKIVRQLSKTPIKETCFLNKKMRNEYADRNNLDPQELKVFTKNYVASCKKEIIAKNKNEEIQRNMKYVMAPIAIKMQKERIEQNNIKCYEDNKESCKEVKAARKKIRKICKQFGLDTPGCES